MRKLPTKKEILAHARRIELSDIVGSGLPAITPEDYELKESGAFHKARRQLMSTQKGEMEKYLRDMAGELKLQVVSRREIKEIEKAAKEKEQARARKYLKHLEKTAVGKKPSKTPMIHIHFLQPIPAIVGSDMKVYGAFKKGDVAKLPAINARILIKQGVAYAVTFPKRKRKKPKKKPSWYEIVVAGTIKTGFGAKELRKAKSIAKDIRKRKPTLKPLSIIETQTGKVVWKEPKPKRKPTVKQIVEKHRKRWKGITATVLTSTGVGKQILVKSVSKGKVVGIGDLAKKLEKPKKKRKRRRVDRAGKTMRKLRKINGVKVFSFPDHVWKVRKPKRKGKKK